MKDVEADLEAAWRAREVLESEAARLQDSLKHADKIQEELERCNAEGQHNAAIINFRNDSLARQVQEGQCELGNANREIARLRVANNTLNRQCLDAQRYSSDMAVNSSRAWGLVNERDRELAFLHGYVAYLVQTSADSREASQAAFSNMEAFYNNRLNFMGSTNQELSKIYQFFQKKNLKEVSKSNEATVQLNKTKADMIAVKQRVVILKQRLEDKNKELKAAKNTSEKLASSRDEIRNMLAAIEKKDVETASIKKKNWAKSKKERSAAQNQTKMELERLESKVQKQLEDVREQQVTQGKLEGELNAEMARQEELKTALKMAENEVARYKDIAEDLQRKVKSLQNEGSNLEQVISEQNVTISALRDSECELAAEADKERRIAAQRQKELWKKMDENEALCKANAKLNGYSFGSAHIILEQLGRNKGVLFVHILKGVHERLQKAMEAESTREANNAVDNIIIYLEAAIDRTNDYVSLMIHDMMAIMAIITDIKKFMPNKIDNRKDITQMTRMCKGIQALWNDVVPLLEDGKKIIERRGWAGGVVGGPMLESSKPRPLLTDDNSLEAFATVQSFLEAPLQLRIIGDLMTTLFGSKAQGESLGMPRSC